jgi:HPt (histidine-containing phosphotransfer) domain-containing protein
MTANAMRGDRSRCLDAGMNDYISKPVSPLSFAIALDKWLTGSTSPAQETVIPAAPHQPDEDEVSLPVFDHSEMMTRIMGDENLARLVINAFLSDMPKKFDLLEKSLDQNDGETATRLIHTIKGAAANVSGAALSATAAALEHISGTGDLDPVKTGFPELKRQFNLLKEALETTF